MDTIFYIPGLGNTKWSALTALLSCMYLVIKFILNRNEKTKGDSMDSTQTSAPESASTTKVGIQETMDVLKGIEAMAIEGIKVSKAGSLVKSAEQLVEDALTDVSFKASLVAMFLNIKNVPSEIKDLDVSEIVQIGQFEFESIPKIIAALKA